MAKIEFTTAEATRSSQAQGARIRNLLEAEKAGNVKPSKTERRRVVPWGTILFMVFFGAIAGFIGYLAAREPDPDETRSLTEVILANTAAAAALGAFIGWLVASQWRAAKGDD